MNKKKLWISIFVCALMLAGATAASAQSAKKMGYLDLSRIFDNYEKTKAYDDVLEKQHASYEEELNKRVEAIQEKQARLAVLTDEEKAKLQQEIDEQTTALRQWDEDQRSELMKKRDERIREILLEVEQIVSDYAQQEGYDLILNDRVLIYGADGFDITDKVLQKLNEMYKK
ncbi:MAG: OmpH family outer membrane protein [Candidatus Omnitrophota bacterium]